MNAFQKHLKVVVAGPPFLGNQRSLALYAGLDRGLLHRVLDGTRTATPEFVGRLCGTLPPENAAQLLKAFLEDIIDETKGAEPMTTKTKTAGEEHRRSEWRRPLSDVSVDIRCKPIR